MNDTIAATQYMRFDTVAPAFLLYQEDSTETTANDTSFSLFACYDSLFTQYADMPVVYRKSMFSGNSHHVAEPLPHVRETAPSDTWIFVSLTILLILMGIYLKRQKFRIKDILQSLFDTRVLDRVARECNIKSKSFIPMTGIYLASIAFVILSLKDQYRLSISGTNDIVFYLTTMALLAAFILVKNSIIRLLGNIFEDKPSTQLYLFNNYLFFFVGALLLPVILLLVFFNTAVGSAALKTAEIIVAIVFIVRLLRGIQLILTNSKSSKLYLFYYLCILEIVPILVMAKIILG